MRRLIMLGPAGSGKGTQGMRLATHYGVPHIASGDLLRHLMESGDSEQARAAKVINEGVMVSDEFVGDLIFAELAKTSGFVLDGYPRNLHQAEMLDAYLTDRSPRLDAVLLLKVDAKELIERLSGRLTCPNCGATYHERLSPPRKPGICDNCGGMLEVRADDQPEGIELRLRLYAERTAPVIGYYGEQNLLREVAAIGTPDEVFARCLGATESITSTAT